MRIIAPVPGMVNSPFGAPRDGHRHQGVDFKASSDTPIIAVAPGEVFKAGNIGANAGLGVEIAHSEGFVTKYFHMSRVAVARGQYVQQGDLIGTVGATGNAKGPHLHFEIWLNGSPIDPVPYLDGAPISATSGNSNYDDGYSSNPLELETISSGPDVGVVLGVAVGVLLLALVLDL